MALFVASQIKLALFRPLHADVGLKRNGCQSMESETSKGARMLRRTVLLGLLASAAAACTPQTSVRVGPDGLPLPQIYRITAANADNIQFRMLDSLNALRQAAGVPAVRLNAQLNAAAATHARDMSVQNRPWHFGSDGSSPIERLRRVGYPGLLVGETISETYETELETLGAWMREPETRGVLLDPNATEMGISWFQENNGKIWWTLVLANSNQRAVVAEVSPIAIQ